MKLNFEISFHITVESKDESAKESDVQCALAFADYDLDVLFGAEDERMNLSIDGEPKMFSVRKMP
jgi:hypothetical protein